VAARPGGAGPVAPLAARRRRYTAPVSDARLTRDLAAPVLAVCGWSGSGKTTLLEAVLPQLTAAGLAVAVVKHDAHGVQVDRPGKDSDRLFRAGATVVVRAPDQTFARRRPGPEAELAAVVADLAIAHDLVLVEGHKQTPMPKVWLASASDPAVPDGVVGVLATLPWTGERPQALHVLLDRLVAEHHARRPLFAGVLLGGASSRMGRPKQLLELAGTSFLERVVAAVSGRASQVVLLGAGPVPEACAALLRLPDPPGPAGPLAGLLAALRWAPAATWIVAACDLPLFDAAAVGWLLDRRAPGRWAVLPRSPSGRLEPLAAIYEPQARPLLERLAASGDAAPRHLAEHAKVVTPETPGAIAAALCNVNTAAELEALRREHRA